MMSPHSIDTTLFVFSKDGNFERTAMKAVNRNDLVSELEEISRYGESKNQQTTFKLTQEEKYCYLMVAFLSPFHSPTGFEHKDGGDSNIEQQQQQQQPIVINEQHNPENKKDSPNGLTNTVSPRRGIQGKTLTNRNTDIQTYRHTEIQKYRNLF